MACLYHGFDALSFLPPRLGCLGCQLCCQLHCFPFLICKTCLPLWRLTPAPGTIRSKPSVGDMLAI